MTDQGPMEPGYRARAEAAEAEVKRMKDIYRCHELGRLEAEARVAELEAECTRHGHADMVARAVSANARADAAEAREQALRDRVAELESERSNPKHGVALHNKPNGGIVCLCGEVCNPKMGRSAARIMGSKSDMFVAVSAGTVFAEHLRKVNAVSPPTADTEGSDRG